MKDIWMDSLGFKVNIIIVWIRDCVSTSKPGLYSHILIGSLEKVLICKLIVWDVFIYVYIYNMLLSLHCDAQSDIAMLPLFLEYSN